ncbi:MAG: YceI family protein [Chloroflexi bacterium]|nr:YceI family protein [Chloroflexota bacterium]
MPFPRIAVGAVAVAIIIAAAGIAGWWFFIRTDAKLATNAPQIPTDLPTRSATTAASTPASTPSGSATPASGTGATTYTILSDRSEAAYFADEKLASLSVPSKAKGSTRDIQGQFYLTPDGLGLDPSRPSSFTVDLTTLKSDKDMRDARVQNQGLQTSTYPTATFTLTSVSGYDPAIPEGDEQSLTLTGTMDLHGVQKELTWDTKARRQGGVITALATTSFKFGDFNIPVLNIAGFVSVQETVTLQVQIVAQAS